MNKQIKTALAVGASAGLGAAAIVAVRRAGSLRLGRGLGAVQLVARGGARYAGSALRLFMTAGEQRQQRRNDLALQTAEDVASTLGAMKGVLMKIGQMASYVDDGLSPSVRRTLSRLQDSVPPMSPDLAAGAVGPSGVSPNGPRCRSPPPPSARCTARSPGTVRPSRSRCSTPASPRPWP